MAAILNYDQVLKRVLLTEKSTKLGEKGGIYTFEVDNQASKLSIKGAVEKLFKVKVDSVRTLKLPGKYKRVGRSLGKTSAWKKAIVSLVDGHTIEFFEGK